MIKRTTDVISLYHFSGDVGIRTRVRKNRPSNVYERSLSLVFVRVSVTDNWILRLAAKARKLLFHLFSSIYQVARQLFDAQSYLRLASGEGGRDPSMRTSRWLLAYAARGRAA